MEKLAKFQKKKKHCACIARARGIAVVCTQKAVAPLSIISICGPHIDITNCTSSTIYQYVDQCTWDFQTSMSGDCVHFLFFCVRSGASPFSEFLPKHNFCRNACIFFCLKRMHVTWHPFGLCFRHPQIWHVHVHVLHFRRNCWACRNACTCTCNWWHVHALHVCTALIITVLNNHYKDIIVCFYVFLANVQ